MLTLRHSISLVCLSLCMLSGCSQTPRTPEVSRADSDLASRAQTLWQKHLQTAQEPAATFDPSSLTLSTATSRAEEDSKVFQCVHPRPSRLLRKAPPITIAFVETELREALVELSIYSQIAIVMDETVEGLVSANLANTPLNTALEILLAGGGYSFRAMENYILVGSSQPDSPSFSTLAVSCRYKPFYTLPLDLAASLTPYFQQFVRVPPNADYLTITAPKRLQQQIQRNIRVFDQAPGQVLLEMSIIEVSRSALDILGVSWKHFGRDANTNRLRRMGAGEWAGVEATSADKLLDAFTVGALPQRTLADSLQLLREEGEATIKAMPSIVSLDGAEAVFATNHQLWLPQIGGSNRQQELRYGVDMKLIPRISSNGNITLHIVKASVSDLTMGDKGVPHITTHQISNSVNVRDGDYLILGGLLHSKQRNEHAGLPKAKDSSTLGWLFGQKQQHVEEMEVLIMIRPQILEYSS